jgi:hypothetical protein
LSFLSLFSLDLIHLFLKKDWEKDGCGPNTFWCCPLQTLCHVMHIWGL